MRNKAFYQERQYDLVESAAEIVKNAIEYPVLAHIKYGVNILKGVISYEKHNR